MSASTITDPAAWGFLDTLGDGVYGVDTGGRCLFINQAALRILGFASAEDVIGRDMHDLVHHSRPDGSPYPREECPLLEVARTGRSVRLEYEVVWHRDGTPMSVQYAASLMPGMQGKASIVTLREMAAAEGDDDALVSPDCVFTIDTGGRIVDANASAAPTFGLALSNVLGRDFVATLFPVASQAVQRARMADAFASDLSTERVEGEARRADGTAFPAEIALFRINSAGRTTVKAHLRDISGRRHEQIAARNLEARFRTMADNIPQLTWITDAGGHVTWYNKRWLDYTGLTFDQMAGWGWKHAHHPENIDRVERRWRHSLETGEPWEDCFPLRAADGTYRWFLSRAMPIRAEPSAEHPDGSVLGWFGTSTDVEEMREAERKLAAARDEAEAANRAKSTFIANMSHELRTPLSAIIGYAEMMAEEIEDGVTADDLASDVGRIESNARHLLGLINDVLDLSKVESGKMEAFAESFDLRSTLEEVGSTALALMEKKANRFKLDLGVDDGAGLGSMHSDVTRVRQILLNLLANAAKFTEAGTIVLAVRRERDVGGEHVRFSVTDSGIGMSEEQLAKLFQRFQQADASTTRQFGGTGLGLALTKAFTSLLGGSIEVSSTPGEGSTFTVTLPTPLPTESVSIEGSSDDAEDVPDETGREVVLVIDDDGTQRDLTSRFLVREGYAARTAADGPSGIALARRLLPRAILLDVTMPGMDGWSVLTALKADPDLAAIPVIMVTFHSERALAASLGAADYVMKPVDWNRLRHVMNGFRDMSDPVADDYVLVVDDEADMRALARQALERNGWSVAEAGNGAEALDQVAQRVPRVILLDLNMPVMDGFACLRELRGRSGCADVPVVVLTALDLTPEDRRRLRGANQILNKGDTRMSDIAKRLERLGVEGRSASKRDVPSPT